MYSGSFRSKPPPWPPFGVSADLLKYCCGFRSNLCGRRRDPLHPPRKKLATPGKGPRVDRFPGLAADANVASGLFPSGSCAISSDTANAISATESARLARNISSVCAPSSDPQSFGRALTKRSRSCFCFPAFQPCDLGQTTPVTLGATEACLEECSHQFPGERIRDHAAAQAHHVQVVVLDPLVC